MIDNIHHRAHTAAAAEVAGPAGTPLLLLLLLLPPYIVLWLVFYIFIWYIIVRNLFVSFENMIIRLKVWSFSRSKICFLLRIRFVRRKLVSSFESITYSLHNMILKKVNCFIWQSDFPFRNMVSIKEQIYKYRRRLPSSSFKSSPEVQTNQQWSFWGRDG